MLVVSDCPAATATPLRFTSAHSAALFSTKPRVAVGSTKSHESWRNAVGDQRELNIGRFQSAEGCTERGRVRRERIGHGARGSIGAVGRGASQ